MIQTSSGARSSPRHNETVTAKQQVKRITDNSPHKFVDDDISTGPLYKKLFRRKLSLCLQPLNIGKYRPKASDIRRNQVDDDDDELGAPQAKKKRMDSAEKCRWEKLSENKDQSKSPARKETCTAGGRTW